MLLNFSADWASQDAADRDPSTEVWESDIDSADVATMFALAVPYLSAPRQNRVSSA